jgi:signal transduction histidine kinase
VHVDAVIADGTPISLQSPVRIGASHQRIIIRYAGLSLAVPDRVRFRYRLDGFDQGWSEPVSIPEASYTNLDPGSYRFQVEASDGSGLWSDSQAVLPLKIAPLYWQTWWFQLSACLALISMVSLLYRLRLQQATAQARERLSTQMAERERIARELHDTILQGFYGIVLRFQTAADQVPEHEPARKIIEDTLDRAEGLLNQGRDTIRGLRGDSEAFAELSEEFAKISEDYQSTSSASFSVAIEGIPRAVHPVVRDEIYRIGHEAIVNAFQHAKASHIEVVLTYDASWLLLRIQDDGQGIDSAIVDAGGRAGHWGMIGMRERAQKIGGQFSVWSRSGAGTEIQLNIPAKLAYPSNPRPSHRFWQPRRPKTNE